MKIKIIFLLSLFVFSCGKRRTEIKGEIFLVNNNNQSQRLAAIMVKIIKKEKAENLTGNEILTTDADYFAMTDADGKFSAKVPNGEYVAAVDYIRDEFEKFHYHYSWRIPVTANGGEKKITLNGTNAQTTATIGDNQ